MPSPLGRSAPRPKDEPAAGATSATAADPGCCPHPSAMGVEDPEGGGRFVLPVVAGTAPPGRQSPVGCDHDRLLHRYLVLGGPPRRLRPKGPTRRLDHRRAQLPLQTIHGPDRHLTRGHHHQRHPRTPGRRSSTGESPAHLLPPLDGARPATVGRSRRLLPPPSETRSHVAYLWCGSTSRCSPQFALPEVGSPTTQRCRGVRPFVDGRPSTRCPPRALQRRARSHPLRRLRASGS